MSGDKNLKSEIQNIIEKVSKLTNINKNKFKTTLKEYNKDVESGDIDFITDLIYDKNGVPNIKNYRTNDINGGNGNNGNNMNYNYAGSKEPSSDEKISDMVKDMEMKYQGVEWDQIIGHEQTKKELRAAMSNTKAYEKLYQLVEAPTKILLYGPPGTGKTTLVKAICNEIKPILYSVEPSKLMSKWMGESEKIINKLFKVAREKVNDGNNVVIFFDEIDTFLSKRESSGSSGGNSLKNQMLQLFDGIEKDDESETKGKFYTIGATNLLNSIDSGFLRRFTKKIFVGLPSRDDRLKLLEKSLNAKINLYKEIFKGIKFNTFLFNENGESMYKENCGKKNKEQICNTIEKFLNETVLYSHSDVSTLIYNAWNTMVTNIIEGRNKIYFIVTDDESSEPYYYIITYNGKKEGEEIVKGIKNIIKKNFKYVIEKGDISEENKKLYKYLIYKVDYDVILETAKQYKISSDFEYLKKNYHEQLYNENKEYKDEYDKRKKEGDKDLKK